MKYTIVLESREDLEYQLNKVLGRLNEFMPGQELARVSSLVIVETDNAGVVELLEWLKPLCVDVEEEPKAAQPAKKIKAAAKPTTICTSCGRMATLTKTGICKPCAMTIARESKRKAQALPAMDAVEIPEAVGVGTTGDTTGLTAAEASEGLKVLAISSSADQGDADGTTTGNGVVVEQANEQPGKPKCSRCGISTKLTNTGMCRSCNIATARDRAMKRVEEGKGSAAFLGDGIGRMTGRKVG